MPDIKCAVCGKPAKVRTGQVTCGMECGQAYNAQRRAVKETPSAEDTLESKLALVMKRQRKPLSVVELADKLDCGPSRIQDALGSMVESGFNVRVAGEGKVELTADVEHNAGPNPVHDIRMFQNGFRKFGVTGDNHLCNKHERLDVLNAAYDMYEAEGITTVYNTGNWIDGEARFNKLELKVFGMDAQIDYWIDNYPQRKGVTTYYVAGDDHEGWYQQRECIEIGRYAMLRAQQAGRNDLVYLGYVESDIELKAKHGSAVLRVMHPGGGSAYATSYTEQKIVESYQGGEKPDILLLGHYHKFNHGYPREVWTVQTGTTCDQTIFMRKKKLQAHVGFGIVEFNQSERGDINRFKNEFFAFYDKGFYLNGRKFAA